MEIRPLLVWDGIGCGWDRHGTVHRRFHSGVMIVCPSEDLAKFLFGALQHGLCPARLM